MLICIRIGATILSAEDFIDPPTHLCNGFILLTGSICGGNCCGRGRELRLRSSLRRSAEARVFADTRPLAELLLSTRRTQQRMYYFTVLYMYRHITWIASKSLYFATRRNAINGFEMTSHSR